MIEHTYARPTTKAKLTQKNMANYLKNYRQATVQTKSTNVPFIRNEDGSLKLTVSGSRIVEEYIIEDAECRTKGYKSFCVNLLKFDEEMTEAIMFSDEQVNVIRSR